MNKLVLPRLAVLLLCLSISSKGWPLDSDTQPVLLPMPLEAQWAPGGFPITGSLSPTLAGVKEERVEGALRRFMDRLGKKTGISFSVDLIVPANFVIDCRGKGLPVQSVGEDESYDLIVTPGQITLSAPNPLGILHGLVTLRQLAQTDGQGWSFRCAVIHDKPRFPWRGLLIDACRHWMPLDVILRNLDGMEEAKLNVFHWHLSDDQGFRIECKTYPKLRQMGSDGHYYTQDQVRQALSYARDRGIRVVPEFDMPGHFTSWLAAYLELASAPGPYEVEKKFGVFDPCLNPAQEETYRFLDGFLGEMAALFPDEYFHIGGDEVNGKHWNQNPAIQRFMYAHGLKTNEDLQGYFNGRVEKILAHNHKRMVGWDEILRPGLPKTIVVQSWRGTEALAQAARLGYDGILSNGYYLDLAHPASAHYAVDPLPQALAGGQPQVGQPSAETGAVSAQSGGQALGVPGQTGPGPLPENGGLTPQEAAHVLGGEACMWSELVTPENVDSRIWPAALAVAERLWSSASVRDAGDFYRRLDVESPRLEEVGLTHRSSYLPMLRRLAGGANIVPLGILADVVEPVRDYQRHKWGGYSTDFPLNRLVDAVRPESEEARHFGASVDAYLAGTASRDRRGLKRSLEVWEKNHKALEPILEKSDLLADALGQSQDLSASARVGLEALQYLDSGRDAPPDWVEKASQTLSRAWEPKAQVRIAVVPAIYKLALAAGEQDQRKAPGDKGTCPGHPGGVEGWVKALDAQVQAALNGGP